MGKLLTLVVEHSLINFYCYQSGMAGIVVAGSSLIDPGSCPELAAGIDLVARIGFAAVEDVVDCSLAAAGIAAGHSHRSGCTAGFVEHKRTWLMMRKIDTGLPDFVLSGDWC